MVAGSVADLAPRRLMAPSGRAAPWADRAPRANGARFRSALLLASLGAAWSGLASAAAEVPERVVKVLRTSDVAQVHRYVPEVFTFRNVQPYAVVRFVRRVLEQAEGAWFCFAHPDGTSGKMLVVAPEEVLRTLRPLMAALDVEELTSSAGSNSLIWDLRHRDVLDPWLLETLRLEGTPEVRLLPDTQTNRLVVRDNPSGVDRVRARLEQLDAPTPQVNVEVTLYEVDETSDGRLGLDYAAWKNGPGRTLFAGGAFAEKARRAGAGSFQGLPASTLESTGRNVASLVDVPAAYLDFLEARGLATTRARLSVAAMSSADAALEVGESVLYHRVSDDPAAGTRVRVPALAERAMGSMFVGTTVRVRPAVMREHVDLDVFTVQTVLQGFADDGTPLVAGRALETRLSVPRGGGERVIGGLRRRQVVDEASKAPWLGDLPILGALFGSTSRIDREVVAFLVIRVS